MHAKWQPGASLHTFDVFSRRCVPQQIYVLVLGVMPTSLEVNLVITNPSVKSLKSTEN